MRIKLKENLPICFKTTVKVRITDLNYGGHVGNEMLLVYAQQARVDFLAHMGYGELTLAGKGIIMTDAAVVYRSEAHAGETLEVAVALDDRTKVGFDLYYTLQEKTSSRLVGRVKTGIVCFDYATKRLSPLPEEVIQQLDQLPTL